MSEVEGKYNLELNFVDDRVFLNFWDYTHGNDVVVQLVNGRLMMVNESGIKVAISFDQYVDLVKKSIQKRTV